MAEPPTVKLMVKLDVALALNEKVYTIPVPLFSFTDKGEAVTDTTGFDATKFRFVKKIVESA